MNFPKLVLYASDGEGRGGGAGVGLVTWGYTTRRGYITLFLLQLLQGTAYHHTFILLLILLFRANTRILSWTVFVSVRTILNLVCLITNNLSTTTSIKLSFRIMLKDLSGRKPIRNRHDPIQIVELGGILVFFLYV